MFSRIFPAAIFIMLIFHMQPAYAQFEKITFDLQKEKPEKFQNRKLRSEKTGEKKFTIPRRFVQNSISQYNYYFNASSKLDAVIEQARATQRDDYRKLLPYYSYSLENTAALRSDLDSIIQTATAGILLHDLRSDWVDNFYLLIGKAYYLEEKFDSAYMAFQFINFNLAPKDKKSPDYNPVVGSNQNNTAGALSIANKEDRSVLQKAFSLPPSRNDALVWQIRTLINMGLFAEAGGLINTLRNDPNFPERLYDYLDEVTGYWFYRQEMYDSVIPYLEASLPHSIDQQDRARREFLLAQLYEDKGSVDTAYDYYSRAIRRTTNPLLDIYANLHRARLLYNDEPQEIRNSVAALMKMARKDKYFDYRHLVYFAAGELALEIPDSLSAIAFYARSAKLNQSDPALKNETFLTLADLSYDRKKYKDAYNYYDSIRLNSGMERIEEKKSALAKIIREINIIEREDSLRQIAAMPTADREAYLKKLSRKLKKERGLPDEEFVAMSGPGSRKEAGDLLTQNNQKGDWYFYNTGMKSRGYNDFKREWGNRQNIDNWRRVTVQPPVMPGGRGREMMSGAPSADPMAEEPALAASEDIDEPEQTDLSIDGLRENLPLNEEQLQRSNERTAQATYALAKHYQFLLEDYPSAISTYETSLQEFPDSLYNGELYMNLSYCYKQIGNLAAAQRYRDLVVRDFSSSEFAQYILNPEKFDPKVQDSVGTAMYDTIYRQFIEGNFEEALQKKQAADSIYGKTHWNPQLLYIEAVYHIRQREDSAAIAALSEISSAYPGTPMDEKAYNLIRVLKNRDSIENYLTHLQVERLPEDSQIVVFDDTRIYGNIPQNLKRDDNNLLPIKITTVDVPETVEERKAPPALKNKNFVFDPLSAQNVVMVLTKVDPVYSSEARTAFLRYIKSNFYNRTIDVVKDTLDEERTLLIFSGFVSAEDAMTFTNRIRKDARAEISWLPADKYVFYIISDDNIELLKENKNLESYLELLRQKFPDKF